MVPYVYVAILYCRDEEGSALICEGGDWLRVLRERFLLIDCGWVLFATRIIVTLYPINSYHPLRPTNSHTLHLLIKHYRTYPATIFPLEQFNSLIQPKQIIISDKLTIRR